MSWSGGSREMTQVRQGYAPVGALRMYYEVHGGARPGRVPLVLIHGGGSTIGTNFGALIPLLTGTRQVIAVEEQGHGHTASIDRPYTLESSADDIAGVLEHLEVPSADVLGFSAGGGVAMRLATRHPGRVRRLILASSFFRRDGMADGFWDSMEGATIEAMPEVYKDADRRINPDPRHQQQLFEQDSQRTRSFEDWPDSDLEAIASPTLVLVADRDVVTVEHGVRMARTIPGARLMVVPGTTATTSARSPPAPVTPPSPGRRPRSSPASWTRAEGGRDNASRTGFTAL
jgi:pimeloyl-ACP methyl ester carboxylesterase